jgi:hypothetical protein
MEEGVWSPVYLVREAKNLGRVFGVSIWNGENC